MEELTEETNVHVVCEYFTHLVERMVRCERKTERAGCFNLMFCFLGANRKAELPLHL